MLWAFYFLQLAKYLRVLMNIEKKVCETKSTKPLMAYSYPWPLESWTP